ncbi:MAG: histidine phosphatase family protein [Acidimicrobiia bacterium]
MELLLLRHGEAARNAEGAGRSDPPLSAQGRAQARRAAMFLACEGVDGLFTSPLRRAVETAEIIGAEVGLVPGVDPDLAEFDRDAPEYLHFEDLRAAGDPRYEAVVVGGDLTPWGVTLGEFRDRVTGCLDRLVGRFSGRRLAVVTHGGAINAYLGPLLGSDRFAVHSPAYTALSRIGIEADGRRVVLSLGQSGHLQGLDESLFLAG